MCLLGVTLYQYASETAQLTALIVYDIQPTQAEARMPRRRGIGHHLHKTGD